MYLDFQQIKEDNPIETVIDRLGLTMNKRGNQYRGECPVCGGSERALAVTPNKNAFYCFTAKKGGDSIELVTHVRECGVKEAAQWLSGAEPEEKKRTPTKFGEDKGFKPLDYLEPDHEAVVALGFEPEDAELLGIGYAKRGLMRGTVAVPVRLSDGTLVGYLGMTEAVLPSSWRF